ncbi:MAG: VTT domain-containing protein [Candidatus Moranbacteria bacterium]|nr:VTT domain-containing protein [Candidatus Moranbacteria bacterium]MDD3965248.1 VTT domain-containing protein [Candidatus Moranbacteria bacterium]
MLEKFFNKKIIGATIGFLVVVIFFVIATIFAQTYQNDIQNIVKYQGVFGMVSYVFITGLAIVFAPVSTLPLIPIAVSVWGFQITSVLSVIGWTMGSQIAFFLSRRYGRLFVKKFISLEKITNFEKQLSQKNIFWTIVFLRMIVPVDVLSYGIGLFSSLSHRLFFLSTLIGVTPFAILFSYAGTLPIGSQMIVLVEIGAFLMVVYMIRQSIIQKKI